MTSSLKRQNELLNQGGIICHSFCNGEGDEEFKGMFVNYHTEKELKRIFGVYFDDLLIQTYPEFEKDDSILLVGRKKV